MTEAAAPVAAGHPGAAGGDDDDERPALIVTPAQPLALAGVPARLDRGLYFLLPQLAGLDDTWRGSSDGRPVWLIAALLFTFGMFGGYVAMFRASSSRAGSRIGWRASYQITMAGLAASRLFAAGGAGGLALTAWALRRSGMRKRTVADKTISFLVLTYLPYTVAVIVCGFGLHCGLFTGPRPVHADVRPGRHRLHHAGDRARDRLHPDRPRSAASARSRRGTAASAGSRRSSRTRPRRPRPGCATRSSTCARATRAARARSSSGPSRSRCCGRRSTRSATRRRSRSSSWPSSSACSATCCRCRAASAASRAG